MITLPRKILERKLRSFLEEDIGEGDITTALIVPQGTVIEVEIRAKETGIVAGIEEALVLLRSLGLQAEPKVADGAKVKSQTVVLRIVGDARTILTAERTILNILSRMSGIASMTRRIVDKVKNSGYKTRVACTRKVAPGLLYFDKKAVLVGGGDVHRLRLDDMVLIKDNHLAIAGNVTRAVKEAKNKGSFSKKIEIEVSTPEEALKAAEANVDIIMLDNFSPAHIKKTLELLEKNGLRGRVLIEASGGINEGNVLKFASTGVDILSLGAITQSAKALDMSLEVVKVRKAKREK
ncbi:MAG: carboxylating nicotinate-nucleotide diphosphorylase [Candidatus Bathyarchaeia archaeon]|jgi:nicotinate-nucleotide pyrophosphorylase (carboxylating)|nr:carboxylating nicotinate-nucleotide diphosphorylase [Candidatus Bathyarchaeota archaeon A05DMB-4]MDH7595713.1 carboxylating nicotinate-nucleotide diphosphorylase [Candidatus Bathyarchaeota archaeon]